MSDQKKVKKTEGEWHGLAVFALACTSRYPLFKPHRFHFSCVESAKTAFRVDYKMVLSLSEEARRPFVEK